MHKWDALCKLILNIIGKQEQNKTKQNLQYRKHSVKSVWTEEKED